MAQGQSRSIRLNFVAFVICAIWPLALGVLWLTTSRMMPTIHVRWAENVFGEERFKTERELSLVWYQAREPTTVRYFLLDSSKENLERIVVHRLVEDTAFIDRGKLVLDNAPSARMWVGDQFATPWPFALFDLSVFGCVISGVSLVLRD